MDGSLLIENPADRAMLKRQLERARAAFGKSIETSVRLQEAKRDADAVRERCKSFSGFVKEAWHTVEPGIPYVHNWHVDAIGEHLEAMTNGEITRLQINMPPGTMKSTTLSVMLGPWEWGPRNKPHLQYFSTSYEAGWARRDSRKHRNMIQSEWYQALWPMELTKTDEAYFINQYNGYRIAVPFNRLTAGRGNRLTIDDPHSVLKAESDVQRRATTQLFRESAQSRLNDPEKDVIAIMMQRLHPEDLCGVIEELGLPYVKLILPMEYNRSLTVQTPWFTDPRIEEGELLFPSRLGREKVDELKVASGPHAWDTQFQQQPKARAGSYYFNEMNVLIEHKVGTAAMPRSEWRPPAMPTVCDAVFAVADTASKTEKKHDGTGVTFFAYTKYPTPGLVAIGWEYTKIEASMLTHWMPNILARGEQLAKQCGARNGWTFCWVEDKDSGVALIQHAARNQWRVKAIPSEITAMGKDGRALSVSGYINLGLFKIAEPAFSYTCLFNGRSRNHLFHQLTNYRMKMGTPDDEDEMFDTACYGVALAFGNKKGF
jgi:hypothetical protein